MSPERKVASYLSIFLRFYSSCGQKLDRIQVAEEHGQICFLATLLHGTSLLASFPKGSCEEMQYFTKMGNGQVFSLLVFFPQYHILSQFIFLQSFFSIVCTELPPSGHFKSRRQLTIRHPLILRLAVRPKVIS
jgi:hypothetical protein